MSGNHSPNETDLGTPGQYPQFPAAVTVEGLPYWLVQRREGDYRLFLALCPHAGGDVIIHQDVFLCPMHFWTFDQAEGICRHDPGERLMQKKVELREDGRLYAVGPRY